MRRHLEKAHRDGQLVVSSAKAPPKQLQHQLQPQQQQQQQCETQQEVLPVVEHTPDQQQPLLPSQFPQEETTYTTMQTVSQQVFYFRTPNLVSIIKNGKKRVSKTIPHKIIRFC